MFNDDHLKGQLVLISAYNTEAAESVLRQPSASDVILNNTQHSNSDRNQDVKVATALEEQDW